MSENTNNTKTMKANEIKNADVKTLRQVCKDNGIKVASSARKPKLIEAVTLHFHPKEEAKDLALKTSKAAKKSVKKDEANVMAMTAIRALVESGSKAVTFKENKTGSVMWVQIHKTETGLENAVISNIRKAAALFKQSCNSFTLAYSGYKCLHIK